MAVVATSATRSRAKAVAIRRVSAAAGTGVTQRKLVFQGPVVSDSCGKLSLASGWPRVPGPQQTRIRDPFRPFPSLGVGNTAAPAPLERASYQRYFNRWDA